MTDFERLRPALPTGLWIDGKTSESIEGKTFPVYDPATGRLIADVADAGGKDALRALDSAAAVQEEWAATPSRQRSVILRSAWEKVIARTDDLALLITTEMGKALPESRAEVTYGAEFLRWFSEEAVRIQGRYTESPSGTGHIVVAKVPVGPTLAITPWNFPLAMGTRKIGPALAAGCTIIVKPAEDTPLTMLLLAEIFTDAGLPHGVLSVLPGSRAADVTEPLLSDARLRKVTFTGSTRVGRILIEQSARNILRTSMELGGNAPFVVFGDADVDSAVDGAMAAKMRNGGQACTAANRLIVANEVREEFTTKLTDRIAALTVGPGNAHDTDVGPLVNDKQRESVSSIVADAVTAGARVRLGAKEISGPGYFYAPTVLDQVPTGARLLREEIFGPVAAITGFDTEEQAIAIANNSEYGLAAYIYTQSLDRAMRVSNKIHSGMVGVNRGVISDVAAPFGGIKHSGLGSEGGTEGIDQYLETKYIAFT